MIGPGRWWSPVSDIRSSRHLINQSPVPTPIRPVRAKVAKHSKALNYMCTDAWRWVALFVSICFMWLMWLEHFKFVFWFKWEVLSTYIFIFQDSWESWVFHCAVELSRMSMWVRLRSQTGKTRCGQIFRQVPPNWTASYMYKFLTQADCLDFARWTQAGLGKEYSRIGFG